MLIREVTEPNAGKLVALVQLLRGRAENTGAQHQISVPAFMKLAQGLGVSVHSDDLNDLLSQEPLSNVFEPYEVGSQKLLFKGNKSNDLGMPPDVAREVVKKNAMAAAKRA